jgi:DNA (cytosine-5)-methyltransferase 1
MQLRSIEICAGAGGQALGLEEAGFQHLALVENDPHACATLRANRPQWNVLEQDVRTFSAAAIGQVDLLSGGVPCPPFSKAGRQLGIHDERDLFPEALRLIGECRPQAVMLENVRGILDPVFDDYRERLNHQLAQMGYESSWKLLNASDFGVPQLRPRALLVGLRPGPSEFFGWPSGDPDSAPTVGDTLYPAMASRGWEGAQEWRAQANKIAPTLVGGSKKHGGPDLGPTRARKAWAQLGVCGKTLAIEAPSPGHEGMPRLTVQMAATIQGFPSDWVFTGKKTAAYRQVGNAFPPPVAHAVGSAIAAALSETGKSNSRGEETLAA